MSHFADILPSLLLLSLLSLLDWLWLLLSLLFDSLLSCWLSKINKLLRGLADRCFYVCTKVYTLLKIYILIMLKSVNHLDDAC